MPSFRLIVVEHTEGPKTGNFVEKLGTYNPKTKEQTLNPERIKHWFAMGAKASGTVHNMLLKAGIITGKKINVLPKKSPPKPADAGSSGEVKKEEVAAPEAASPAPETKAEEVTPTVSATEEAAPVEIPAQ